jgi:hypothetical protein
MKLNSKAIVEELLTSRAELRDNDIRLCVEVWKRQAEEYGVFHLPNNSTGVFFGMLLDGKITMSDTILRIRRKLQQQYPHLRGYKYERRQRSQKKVVDSMETISAESANPSYSTKFHLLDEVEKTLGFK